MSVGHRDESDAQLVSSDRGLVGVADVTAARVASSKTTHVPFPPGYLSVNTNVSKC